MSKEKQIKKVVVLSGGLKGLEIHGTVESIKENRFFINGFKDTVKHPIHILLEDKIKDLRYHALNITGLITDKTSKDEHRSLIDGCEVLAFEVGSDCFAIKVSSRVFDTKYITLTTPKVDSSDNYEFFKEANELLSEIMIEVHAYMKGLKKITDEEITIRYIQQGKDKNVDMDVFRDMSNEDKITYMTALMEKLGCMVITNEDMDVEHIDVTEEILELEMKVAEPVMLKK